MTRVERDVLHVQGTLLMTIIRPSHQWPDFYQYRRSQSFDEPTGLFVPAK